MTSLFLFILAATVSSEASNTPEETPSSFPNRLTAAEDRLFFSADDGFHGEEFWMWIPDPNFPGNGRCEIVADLEPGLAGTGIEDIQIVNGWAYFESASQSRGNEIWLWDPKNNRLEHIQAAGLPAGWRLDEIIGAIGSNVILGTFNDQSSYGLCGGPIGGTEVQFIPNSVTGVLNRSLPRALLSETVYLFGTQFGLFRSNGFSEDTSLFLPVDLATGYNIRTMVHLNGAVLFTAMHISLGDELWISDGTVSGTRLLKDIYPGPNGSEVTEFHRQGSHVLFKATDGAHGIELWRSDGTPEGTFLLRDIAPGMPYSDPNYACSVGEWVYFVANDSVHGKELWRTDGTEEGTHLVVDLMPGQASGSPWSLAEFQGKLFFCANSPDYGEEVYFTGGAEKSASVLKDIVPGPGWSGPNNLCVLGNYLYFTCNDEIHGEELWMSDGTANGTRLAADIRQHTQAQNPSSSPRELTAAGEKLLFTADASERGKELWISDGSETGTRPLMASDAATRAVSPSFLTASPSLVFFSAEDEMHGREPWVYDPNTGHCGLLRDICPGQADSSPKDFLCADGCVYFSADDGEHGRRLWRSSATGDHVEMLALIPEYAHDLNIVQVFPLLGRLYCYVDEGPETASLWRVAPGQAQLECLLHFFTPLPVWEPNDPCIFPATGNNAPLSDALLDELYLAGAICPFVQNPLPPETALMDGRLYFTAYTNAHGAELWSTDGTRAGTSLVCDIYHGRASSSPKNLIAACGKLYFIAEFPSEGRVLGQSDGTNQGTYFTRPINRSVGFNYGSIICSELAPFGKRRLMLASLYPIAGEPGNLELGRAECQDGMVEYYHISDINHKSISSRPRQFTEVNGRVFFTADDGIHGEELWVTDAEDDTRMVKDILPSVIIPTR